MRVTLLLAVTGWGIYVAVRREKRVLGQGSGPATSYRDLRRKGAKKGVARAIAYPAVVFHFVLLLPAMMATGMGVILVG